MTSSSEDLANTYQKKTQIEHIKDAPDTYIGGIEEDDVTSWTMNDENTMVHKKFGFIPGLYKCFDEGIVNCRDHYIRLWQKLKNKEPNIVPVSIIDISVNKETGVITMINDGNGIDVEKHPEHNIYIPEMIFGHLMTSTNYKKNAKKITGGKNGFGFKLVLIYSTWGRIETVDHIRGKKYIQEFKDNLGTICKPKITKVKKAKPYTKVEFKLDFERFGIDGFNDDIFNILKKRTYDIAAVTDRNVRVKFNGELLPVRTFEDYINLYIGTKSETKRVFEKQDRFEYGVCLSPLDEFTQVSFVNGVYTMKGGKHVDYIMNQIIKKIVAYIYQKKKIKVKPVTVKEQLMLFVNTIVENPSFDSQTKNYLNTPAAKFGVKCTVSDKFIDQIVKRLGVMEAAISLTEIKDTKAARKTDGRKTSSIRGIPKLTDANWAGTRKSWECTLILTEGDSAKAGVISGLSKQDRNQYGVFPLKGKLMNVKDMTQKKLNDNIEITNIKKILGLEAGQTYTLEQAKKKLRYGRVMFMTDQDLDGSHIKGLCINLFHSQWPDLMKLDSFLGFMNTPIIKAKKGSREKSFYTEQEYQGWKTANNDGKGWVIKYFKGLGTSTAKEFKQYFADKKVVSFKYAGNDCDNALDRVFNKKRADDRKDWLRQYEKDSILDIKSGHISYRDFADREMIHFSKYDCDRSIPNLMDGSKISTRKILYACFKRNLTKEIKVAQLAGYVSEHSGYHHGEMSLVGAIIGMAQEFMGSNNVNPLMPKGQFGTRLKGGKDHASERYIFTNLTPIAQHIYNSNDNPILTYLDDDGTPVEPEYYAPIIPMVCVNGTKGIGTGFSCDIPSYNPLQIIDYLKYKLNKSSGESKQGDHPKIGLYYEGFKGTISYVGQQKYLFKGCYELIGTDLIKITELPVGTWTEDYKAFLESLMDDKDKKNKKGKSARVYVKSYTDMSTDTDVEFTVRLIPGTINKLLPKKADYGCNQLEKTFKLYTTKTETNMYLFDNRQRLSKYNSVYEIIDTYFPVRLDLYQKRKDHMIKQLERDVMKLHNEARFIEEQCEDIIDLRRKKKQQVIDMLVSRKFDVLDGDEEYKYLRTMRMEQVEEENIEKLRNKRDEKKKELETLKNTSPQTMWNTELDNLVDQYHMYRRNRIYRKEGVDGKKPKKIKKVKKVKKTNPKNTVQVPSKKIKKIKLKKGKLNIKIKK
jgi:DNA topoisomerase II